MIKDFDYMYIYYPLDWGGVYIVNVIHSQKFRQRLILNEVQVPIFAIIHIILTDSNTDNNPYSKQIL